MAADSLAYIPGFRHDLFVSYAQVDDQLPGAEPTESGWVHALGGNLRTLLAQQLGRADWGDIWIDTRIDPTQGIPAEVDEALKHSALLLIVLSEGWLKSPWCPYELETFVQHHGVEHARGRVFVAHRTLIAPDRRPQAIRDLIGYHLYERNRDGRERPLGFPLPSAHNAEDRPYFERLDDLSRDLGARMVELQRASGAPEPTAPVPPSLQSAASAPIAGTTDAAPTEPKAIYIAEGTPDLRGERERLTRQLKQSGFTVRPAELLPADPAKYRAKAADQLAASILFVQLLGRYTLDKRPDLPQGYEALQLELAQQHRLHLLRWLDPAIGRDAMDDPELYRLHQVVEGGFDDFKRLVEQTAGRLLLPQPADANLHADGQVLIRAAEPDEDAAYTIGDRLAESGVGYELADEDAPLAELISREDARYRGLMVIYDRCDRGWARDEVKECDRLAGTPDGRAASYAVYEPKRPGKPRLGIRFPRFHWLSAADDPGLVAFAQAVAGASR